MLFRKTALERSGCGQQPCCKSTCSRLHTRRVVCFAITGRHFLYPPIRSLSISVTAPEPKSSESSHTTTPLYSGNHITRRDRSSVQTHPTLNPPRRADGQEMIINGEKFACEACVRGHRVSSCHHTDRHLVHVNKKGRPVSQCQHCRGLRKARSQHVHCECQTKGHGKDECPHGKDGDGNIGKPTIYKTSYISDSSENGTCCCNHSGKCTCSLKKEHLDPVVEDMHQLIQPKGSPKLHHVNHNSHDPKATIFQNGHHKPVHKFNDIHNQCAPYKIPGRSNTVHGHREIAQRSTDSLPLTNTAKPHHESPLHTSVLAAEARKVKSEHNSPMLAPTAMSNNGLTGDFQIPPFDPNSYGYSPFGSTGNVTSEANLQQNPLIPENIPPHWFFTYDQAQEYGNAVDWNQYNFDSTDNLLAPNANENTFPSSQVPPLGIYNQFNTLNDTLPPSSGDISEVEDYNTNSLSRPSVPRTMSQDASESFSSPPNDEVKPDNHRLSTASSYYNTPQANPYGVDDASDIDEILRQAAAETQRMSIASSTNPLQQMQQSPSPYNAIPTSQAQRLSNATQPTPSSSPLNMSTMNPQHPFTIHEAQEMAHMNQSMAQQKLGMPSMPSMPTASSMPEDPSWSVAPDLSDPAFVLDDEQEAEDWVR